MNIPNFSTADRNKLDNKRISVMFKLLVINLIVPIIDIPIFGFSITAVIYALIIVALIRSRKIDYRKYRKAQYFSLWIVFVAFLSMALAGLKSGGVAINSRGINIAIHYAYWLLVFFFSVYIIAEKIIKPRELVSTARISITVLAMLRLFEAIVYGKTGAWTGTVFFTQNTYGFLFSMFAPFTLFSLVDQKNKSKILPFFQAILVFGAVLINGSRGSWIALGITFVIFVLLWLVIKPSLRNFAMVVFVVVFFMLSFNLAEGFIPTSVQDNFQNRLQSFDDLSADKSYQIRLLMLQKGMKLFQSSPIFGVGTSRFVYEVADLELPSALSYSRMYKYNSISAHNSYISYLSEQGLIGAIPFFSFILIIAFLGGSASIKLARKGRYWAVGVYLCFVSMSIHMWGINSLTNTANWLIYALNIGAIYIAQNPEDQEGIE